MEQRQPYSRHPEWFKLEVVKFYYDHGEDRKLTLQEYGIDHSCLRDWLRKYSSREKALSLYAQIQRDMRKQVKQLPSDPKVAQAEYERIQRELEQAQMRAKGLDVMIDLAERVNGIVKNEYLSHHGISDTMEAYSAISRAIGHYNNVRPHMSLGYATPAMVYDEPCKKGSRAWKKRQYGGENAAIVAT